MKRGSVFTRLSLLAALVLVLGSSGAVAAEINTSVLSQNDWFSDDTRADGTGTNTEGSNLVSDTLTDDPEATASGSPTDDPDINQQIVFGVPPGTVPTGTHPFAVNLNIAGGSNGGKSQVSHRKDDATGLAPGSSFGPGVTAEYHWYGDGTASTTASLKFGIKTSQFGGTGTSSRTGENVWDKLLIYEPGNGNSATSDGTWQTETIDWTTGKWWFFDRNTFASTIGNPKTLSEMSTSLDTYGAGAQTIQDVYDLITASGSIVTSAQFGIGSFNQGANVYVNQLETNFYRSSDTTTFGGPPPAVPATALWGMIFVALVIMASMTRLVTRKQVTS